MRRRPEAELRRKLPLAFAVALATFAFVVVGCGNAESTSEGGEEVTVFAVGAPAGLRASLDVFEEQTGITVRLTGSDNFVDDLRGRVSEGDPPDIALFPQPALIEELARAGDLVPLSADVAAVVDENYAPGVRQLGEVDGELFGVFVAANMKSLVWYSPALFEEFGYAIPETWEELSMLTETMRAHGVRPWCFGVRALGGESGWPATDWIEDIVLHSVGREVYAGWVQGEIPFDDPRIEEAFSLFEQATLAPGQTFNGRRGILGTLWNRAGEPLFTDPPGCFLNHVPSFWRSSLPAGTTIGPDGDIDFFPLPILDADVGNAALVGGDTAAAFDEREEVIMLLEYLASPESGEPWAAQGGYISPHRDFDPATYTDSFDRRVAQLIAEASLIGFDGSDLMPVEVGEGTFREGMLNFIQTRDFPSTVRIIDAGFEIADRS